MKSVFLLVFLPAAALLAQPETATLRGTVTDAAGAPVPGIRLTITDTETDLEVRRTVTDSGGHYDAPYLKPGRYEVVIEQKGYRTFVGEGIVLVPGQIRRLDPQLPSGPLEESAPVNLSEAPAPKQ